VTEQSSAINRLWGSTGSHCAFGGRRRRSVAGKRECDAASESVGGRIFEGGKMTRRITVAIIAMVLVIVSALLFYVAMTPRLAPSPADAGLVTASTQQVTMDTSGIFVSGTGKVRITPNIATANVGVEITTATLAEATSQADSKMNAIITRLKGLGIAEKDIQTTSYNITPLTQQPRPGVTPAITGYRVHNQLSITIRKIEDVGKVLDAVVAAGANNVYGLSFGIDDPAPYQQQARAAAIKAAQDKARQLAQAANVTLGKVISISESGAVPVPMVRTVSAVMSGEGTVPIETGELEISVTVEMRFAIQ